MLSATVFEHGDIGYFLNANPPRLERYDIPHEAWLSPVLLADSDGGPTAGLVDDDGIYVAYDKAVYRYDADGGGRTHVLNAQDPVIALHSDGNLLFVNHTAGLYARFISVNKTTNTIVDTFENYVDSVRGSSIARGVNRIFGRTQGISPSDISYVAYDDNGNFTGGGASPYHGDYPGASITWVFPNDGKVVDNSGTIYSTSGLTRMASFGSSITDIDFFGDDVPIILSGDKLTAYTSGILPAGSTTLDGSPSEIFVNDTNVITFTPDATLPSGFRAATVPLSELDAPTPGEPVDPVGLPFTPDKIERSADGDVLLYSKTHQSIFRWDPATRSYSATIPLVGTAEFMAYSAVTDTAYLAYESGLINQIRLGAANPAEVPFAILPDNPIGLATCGEYVFAADPSGAWCTHYTFAPDGTLVDSVDWNYYSREYIWSSANQKMYFFRDDTSPNDLLSEEIHADGGIGGKMDSPLHTSTGFSHPIRVAPDGSVVVLGSGMIHDATSLARQTLALANSISDAAWLGRQLYTVRGIAGTTQYQRWAEPTYALERTVQTTGNPHALLAIAEDRLLGITIDSRGIPVFTVMNGNLDEAEYLGLTPATLPIGTVGMPYSQTITASGGTGAVTLAVSNVQGEIPGLAVPLAGTGSLTIEGTPTAGGIQTFTVTATDPAGTTTAANYTLTVYAPVLLSPGTLPAGMVNTPYSQTITAGGGTGAVTLAVSNVQGGIPGLVIPQVGTGSLAIEGTPTDAGGLTFTVTATDTIGSTTSADYTITVYAPVTFSPSTLPAGMVNMPYSQTITASGGTGTFTLAVSNIQSMIPGLALLFSHAGSLTIAGTPADVGTQTFDLTATDTLGHTTTAQYSVTVSRPLELSPPTLPPGMVNTAYRQTITASGGMGDKTITVSDVTNPIPGLELPVSGLNSLTIAGRPRATGTTTFTVTATDADGKQTTTIHTITVSRRAETTTTLAVSTNASVFGRVVTLTATVTSPSLSARPMGIVTFLVDGKAIGRAALMPGAGEATARLNTRLLPVGTHSITAVYSGRARIDGSTSAAIVHTVEKAGTEVAIQSSANPSEAGTAVTLTARVSVPTPVRGVPGGSVSFFDGTTPLGTAALRTGWAMLTAVLTVSKLDVGTHNITAVYSGDSQFEGSVSPELSLVVSSRASAWTFAPDGVPSKASALPLDSAMRRRVHEAAVLAWASESD